MNDIRFGHVMITAAEYAYKGLAACFFLLSLVDIFLGDGAWINNFIVFLILLPLFILISLRKGLTFKQ